jgi:alpha-galactosidase
MPEGRRPRCLAAGLAAAGVMALAVAGCTTHGTIAPAPAADACSELTAGPARTPPPVEPMRPAMGFNPFNTFGTTFDQSLIVAAVKAMARNGMRAAGYHYVILDDGWQGPRTAGGQLTADPRRFPCGIRRLARFVHREGFDFGLYTTPGPRSCAGRDGSAGHVRADARTFARWGVDYVKLDWCNADYAPAAAAALARQWRAALTATHRPVILSINAGGAPTVAPWAHTVVSSWRVGGDICGSWYNQSRPPSPTARRCYHDRLYHMGIVDYLRSGVLRRAARYAGPGHYLDPDMLEVGTLSESATGTNLAVDSLTSAEAMTNFAMWAMWSAPLIAGNDPRTMNGTDAASQILLNREIIAVDQDPLGRPAALIVSRGGWQVWRKPLAGGRTAVAVVNLADRPAATGVTWAELGLGGPPAGLRDLVAHRATAVADGLRVRLGAHATAVYLLAGSHPA